MDDNMVERVARAIYERGAMVPWSGFARREWGDLKADGKLFFYDCARAAIAATEGPPSGDSAYTAALTPSTTVEK